MIQRAAVIGHPIAHSLSPVLHRAAYGALGLSDWTYEAIDVAAADGVPFVHSLQAAAGWRGLSVTAPLKTAILPALDDVSAVAQRVGAVNTVLFDAGRRLGDNTDVIGMTRALGEAGVTRAASVAVVGAGGTAAAALAAADRLAPSQVLLTARRSAAAHDLVAGGAAGATPVTVVDWDDLATVLACEVVIVTLPADAAAPLAALVPAGARGTLLDVTYAPWPTTLASRWQADGGGRAIGGHRMLLWQAAAQVRLMTGLDAPVSAMSDALGAALVTRSADSGDGGGAARR